MTKYFSSIEELKTYFETFNFNSWLMYTFEIKTEKDITFSVHGGLITLWIHYDSYIIPLGTYGVEGCADIVNILKETIDDPYN